MVGPAAAEGLSALPVGGIPGPDTATGAGCGAAGWTAGDADWATGAVGAGLAPPSPRPTESSVEQACKAIAARPIRGRNTTRISAPSAGDESASPQDYIIGPTMLRKNLRRVRA